jgi:hypothetical protein
MSIGDFLTLATIAAAVLLITPFLGRYIHRVMEGERVFLSPVLRPVERAIYRVCGIDEGAEQDWKGYAIAVLAMAFLAIVAGVCRLPPAGRPAVQPGWHPADVARARVQHIREFRDEHELAELFR